MAIDNIMLVKPQLHSIHVSRCWSLMSRVDALICSSTKRPTRGRLALSPSQTRSVCTLKIDCLL